MKLNLVAGALALAAAAAAAGCGVNSSQPAPGSVRGTLAVTGTAQEAYLTVRSEDGTSHIVQGDLASEMRTLAGMEVLVHGEVAASGMGRIITADSFEILAVNGQRPIVGVVLDGDRLVVAADTLRLIGAGTAMRPGQRVWIVGTRAGGELRVQSWGPVGHR
jgi:hypothetical protein